MLHIINICFGVFCICSPRKYFIFQTGVLDTHPARAPQPSCAWECHQLNEKQRWREKDLLGGSLQGPQRSDSARWMQQDFFLGGGGCWMGGSIQPGGLCTGPGSDALGRSDAIFSERSSRRLSIAVDRRRWRIPTATARQNKPQPTCYFETKQAWVCNCPICLCW